MFHASAGILNIIRIPCAAAFFLIPNYDPQGGCL